MSTFNMVASMNESTVVSEYTPESKHSDSYQSEAELEKELIRMLTEQGYEYLQIHSEAELIENLRYKLEQLNSYDFTDSEWERFFREHIANANEGIVEKTRTIQEDYTKILKRDDGSTKNIRLLDKGNIHNNRLQVINQYEVQGKAGNVAKGSINPANYDNRYDVTILVNGLPLVHMELKRRGVAIREAFNQINRYQRDSFWSGCGLYEYVQIFIISNGTNTKYYSNTTRFSHLKEQEKSSGKGKKTSNSFEFTSFWADANNKVISDLVDFTKTFLSKHTILNILTKYCVFTSEEMLLVMRPYQIAATEKILNRIEIATNYKKLGTLDAGGYVWHTTGSGKTLTSFKTAQLASQLDFVDKVLFVVDRKDLDYQTMKEYDRFQKGAANSNTSTAILQRQLENKDKNRNYHEYKIIITTIQKLDGFIRKNKGHEIFNKHVVLIFDECHRSQFGDMHTAIIKNFKKYHIFGFTGTPIFSVNAAGSGKHVDLRTTPQAFGEKLHTYTIVDAINDGNVLPFRIDYITTIKDSDRTKDKQISAIDTEKALLNQSRIREIVSYILGHFDQKTKRNGGESFTFSVLANVEEVATAASSRAKDRNKIEEKKNKICMRGFNSIFAVSSIEAAKLYYTEFKRQMKDLPEEKQLRVATIFSYGVNETENDDFVIDENSENTDGLDQSSRDFLESAIVDYNKRFSTSYNTSSEKFQNYYKDVSLRMKNREIDILIVVNMFLTGFDATTLNTLWVDKNLKYHGLLQAFSRTNRILNSVKAFGNIVCFRNLEHETNDAIALFGNKEAGGIVLLKNYASYYNGYDENGKHYEGYTELIDRLQTMFPLGHFSELGEQDKKKFISLYGAILKMRNILSAFDDFAGQEILSPRDFQDYQSEYIDLYHEFKPKRGEKENINDDVVFEIELVKQIEVNIDYILMLVKKYQKDGNKDKEIVVTIEKAVNSSLNLRSKIALIREFLSRVNADTEVDKEWLKYVDEQREQDLVAIIKDEKLKEKETHLFIENSFRDGVLKTTGTDIDAIMPAVSRFGGGSVGNRTETKKRVIDRLMVYFEKYLDLVAMK